jgi:hypothetical protein
MFAVDGFVRIRDCVPDDVFMGGEEEYRHIRAIE